MFQVSLRSEDESLRLSSDFCNNGIFGSPFVVPVVGRDKSRIHGPLQDGLYLLQTPEEIGVSEVIADHHQIDIAARRVGAFGN
jgi:hypothetical protein